jgi:hypothetical protein
VLVVAVQTFLAVRIPLVAGVVDDEGNIRERGRRGADVAR